MANKKFINSPADCVEECLYGFSKLHPNLHVDHARKIVFNAVSSSKRKVGLVSGGGSGHEPFPSGYVGAGMLTASVSGSVFASPPSSNILHAIRLAAEECEEILVIVANYTGDVLNFGLAAETAISKGISVENIVVGEDVAQQVHGMSSKAGKRGMCGIVLIFKIAGYLSETGRDLKMIKKISNEVVRMMASVGLCISSVRTPNGELLFHLDEDEMYLGVGVHGEAGVARIKLVSAREAIKTLLECLTESLGVVENDEVVALVNNLGALSYLEQWLVAGEVEKQLSGKDIKVMRLYAGRFFTSLNMAGVQVCILKLQQDTKEMILNALDHQTEASAWPKPEIPNKTLPEKKFTFESWRTAKKTCKGISLPLEESSFLKKCLIRISDDLIKEEMYLNRLDSACGDGDCGTTLSCAARAILSKTNSGSLDFPNPALLFLELSLTMQETIGGTSGALYGLFFHHISKELEKCESSDALTVAKAWKAGVDGIKKYSTARLGDRTMLDPLETACGVFEEVLQQETAVEALRRAVEAATKACEDTKTMKAAAGRASYTDQSLQKYVDAGAYAVTIWLSAILSAASGMKEGNISKQQ